MKRLTEASAGLDTVINRYIHMYDLYLKSLVEEVRLRRENEVLSVKDYVVHRRENSTVRFYHIFIEVALGVKLSKDVLEDPDFIKANNLGIDLTSIANVSFVHFFF